MDAISVRSATLVSVVLLATSLVSGCGGDSGSNSIVFEGDFPVAFVERDIELVDNPVDPVDFRPGGDLYIAELAAASSRVRNVTRSYTQGQGDVADPSASYDGTRVVFAMRGANDPTWNIWEYDTEAGELSRVIEDDEIAHAGDDLSPAYLPDGRIVFSSNRQEKTRALMEAEGVEPYAYLDQAQRQTATVLHVMNSDGSSIQQISFNPNHDRHPSILMDGRIVYSRWDKAGSVSRFPIYTTHPDGTETTVLYGANSAGANFLHPQEMPDGRLIASILPQSGTYQGGALAIIDYAAYYDEDNPIAGAGGAGSAQTRPNLFEIPFDNGPSAYGRFATPHPVWDRNNKVLTAFTPYQAAVRDNPLTGEPEAAEGPPVYGIYVLDLDEQSQRPIALPPRGRMLTNPVALVPRSTPANAPGTTVDAELAAEDNGYGGEGMGIVNINSVYDSELFDLLEDSVLVPGEELPRTPGGRVDVAQLRNPALATAAERPARFLRVSRAVPMPPGLPRGVIGTSPFPMQQLIGYAEIEPDGSVRVKVPADMPLSLAVVDAYGRSLYRYPGWFQVRPGETHTCTGCPSRQWEQPQNRDRAGGTWTNATSQFSGQAGETMAEARTRIQPSRLDLMADILYQDVWTHSGLAERDPDPDIEVTYERIRPGFDPPEDGIINYPQHIQELLWEKWRDGITCIACHSAGQQAGGLNLENTLGASGRLASYDALTKGAPIIDPETGLPEVEVVDGRVTIRREPALVDVGRADQGARTSHLIERMLETELRSGREMPDLDEAGVFDHRDILYESELRILIEWVELGAQYYNDPYRDAVEDPETGLEEERSFELADIRGRVQGLSESTFIDQIHPILMNDCAACHQAYTSQDGLPNLEEPNPGFNANRFILTGNPSSDFNMARAMINNVCEPDQSDLLRRPSSTESNALPHPNRPESSTPVLDPEDPDYVAIFNWIAAAVSEEACP
ncbi:hypothetical protein CAI21_02815 [Alkalilimnicola ehrlichii]|uniref:Hydrazine synthase alpha subunit middle domain-containing protein n=1 Tax=Alkalilimnicola ehrlichii TaxID=351052 RepID=A0A3E0X324_9GAMM|nr:PD40 domain-containing protein [Alkalilimnicola ehrlichii]RFA30925.1 hypothetical protein CAI21_02815 [Alkalilimnicola ehrlichii]RFA38875.1 hypothetical protein CAL65_02950 [Alkalilimnicola ehrlichii]